MSKIFQIFFTGTAIFLLSSCTAKIKFQQSTIVPAAEGSVKVKKDKNGNYAIDLDVIHLAGPDRLNPPAAAYVVWIQTSDDQDKNIGQLKSSSNWLSRALKGSMHASTAFKPTKVFITAEMDAAISYPHGQVILTTNPL